MHNVLSTALDSIEPKSIQCDCIFAKSIYANEALSNQFFAWLQHHIAF